MYSNLYVNNDGSNDFRWNERWKGEGGTKGVEGKVRDVRMIEKSWVENSGRGKNGRRK